MKITISEIEIIPVRHHDGLLGFASCVVNASLYLSNISIRTDLKNKDYRLVFPTKCLKNGTQLAVFNPINKDAYECLRKAIVSKYRNLVGENVEKSEDINGYSKSNSKC